MKGYSRGVALPETAIVLGMVMLLLLGTMELALLGFEQAQAGGAAFVAAHSIAIADTGDDAKDKTYAMSILASPFPMIGSGDVTVSHPSSAPGTVQVVVSKDLTGIVFPGVTTAAGTVNVTGIDQEPAPAPSAAATPASAIGVQATLANFCRPTSSGPSCNANYSLYVAQFDSISGAGQGKNGQFAEWNCRYGLFPNSPGNKVTYPSTMPSDGGPGSRWDPSSNTFNQAALYAFDASTNKWGTVSSC